MTMEKIHNLYKIVYFDEQAAIDYIEIIDKGSTTKVVKELSERDFGASLEGKFGKGFMDWFNIGISGNVGTKRQSLIETQVTRTILSHFIENINKNSVLKEITNVSLKIPKESATFYRNLMPLVKIIEDVDKISSKEDREALAGLNILKLDQILDEARGYYEFIATNNNENCIVRFNISGMRNNYSLNDLIKMDLKLYGLKVGTTDSLDLKLDNEINEMLQQDLEVTEADFDEMNKRKDMGVANSKFIDIFDIILAGV